MGFLVIQSGNGKGTKLTGGEGSITIGRGERAGLRLVDGGSSRQHAEVFRMGALAFIRDLGSPNGTYLNDHRVEEAVLRDGDQVRIGETVILYLEDEGALRHRPVRMEEGMTIAGTLHHVSGSDAAEHPSRASSDPSEERKREARERPAAKVLELLAAGTDPRTVLEEAARLLAEAVGAERVDVLLA